MKGPTMAIPLSRRIVVFGATLLGALVAAFVLFDVVIQPPDHAPVIPVPPDTGATTADSFAFSFLDQPRALPELRFSDGNGAALTLADFRDRPVLLNIWATWCVPCRQEMPSLDRLQAKLGTPQLVVLPLSIDRQGLPVVKQFYAQLGLASLGTYLDPSSEAASAINAVGVPTTLLIDRDGREMGRKIGPAEWDSPEVVALLREHFGLAATERQASP